MPLWTPADLAVAPAIWFSARRSTITQSSGVVSAVSNLGSVGGSFATVSTRAPTYLATGWDGVLPSLNFNDDAMLLSASHTGNQMSVFVVSEETGDSVSSILSFRTPSQAGWQNIGNMNFGRSYFQDRYMVSRNVNDVFWAVPFQTKNIAAALWNSAGMTAFTNGTSTPVVDGSGNPTSTSGMAGNFGFTQVYLGDGAASTDQPFTGKAPEAVVLNYQPTSSEREQVEGYLAWEWGIQALLPSGHPYRNAAPQTGAADITGSMSAIESGADILSASISVAVSGSVAAGESGLDVITSNGSVAISGSVAASEALSDNFDANGTVTAAGPTGSMSAVEVGPDALSAVGTVSGDVTPEPSYQAYYGGSGFSPKPKRGEIEKLERLLFPKKKKPKQVVVKAAVKALKETAPGVSPSILLDVVSNVVEMASLNESKVESRIATEAMVLRVLELQEEEDIEALLLMS